MTSYQEQVAHEAKVRSFLSVFFGALQNDETEIFEHIKPNLFPGVFDAHAMEYLICDSGEHGVTRLVSGPGMVIFQQEKDILCIHKLAGQDIFYGQRLQPTKEVSSDWLKSLTTLIAYAAHARKNALRDVIITHQYSGYRIFPVSLPILKEKYLHQLNRAQAIL